MVTKLLVLDRIDHGVSLLHDLVDLLDATDFLGVREGQADARLYLRNIRLDLAQLSLQLI